MRTKLLLSLSLLSLLAACSNPVCDEAVLRHLDECKLRVGTGNLSLCAPYPDAQEGVLLSPSLLADMKTLCEIQDPQTLDADCLRTTSCEDLAANPDACREASSGGTGATGCAEACVERHTSCEATCEGEAHDRCTDCVIRCATARKDCIDVCNN